MHSRKEREKIEDDCLAPYALRRAESRGRCCVYIAGMTDRYVIEEFQRFELDRESQDGRDLPFGSPSISMAERPNKTWRASVPASRSEA